MKAQVRTHPLPIALGLGFLLLALWVVDVPRFVSRTFATVGGIHVGPVRCTEADLVGQEAYVAEECKRLQTYGTQLLDQKAHAPVTTVAIYHEPDYPQVLNRYGGYHDGAVVAFTLSDGKTKAFAISCGAGMDKTVCFDPRPRKAGRPDHAFVP